MKIQTYIHIHVYTRHTTKTIIHSYARRHTTTSPKTKSKHTNTTPWAIGSVPHRPHPATVLMDYVFARDSPNPPVPQRPSTHRPGGPGGRKSAFHRLRYDKHKNTRTHTDGHTSRDEDGLLLASRKGAPAGTHAGGATRRDDVIRLPPEATVCALVTTGGMTDQPPIRREEL